MDRPKYWDEKSADMLLLHANGGVEAWHDVTEEFPMEAPSAGKRLWLIHSNIPENWPTLTCSMAWYSVKEVKKHIKPMLKLDYWEIKKDLERR